MKLQINKNAFAYQSYDTWIKPVIPSTEGDKLILNCSREFVKDWIESRYLDLILEVIQSILPSLGEVEIRVVKKTNETIKGLFANHSGDCQCSEWETE
ncbi:DnaA N-terminal domain-containing protein [Desulfosporosinus sp. OT]|uniref:DnaA N-terminal domain-containing protein n=1 Tax=Desulfosporosinus sp. OT TaxID=913865 RepID=UPI001300C438|nr:DnaA N-terminal domain-containing protein [Desulfosporosinus sp. OT]